MKLIKIFNDLERLARYDASCVHYIMVDLERLHKNERQPEPGSWISDHTCDTISLVKDRIRQSKCLVRIDPFGPHSKDQVHRVLDAGADAIMLPMFKSRDEVEGFLSVLSGQASAVLLAETAEAVKDLSIYSNLGEKIEWIHVGLNDLSRSLGLSHMLCSLASEPFARFVNVIKSTHRFGVGGVGSLDAGLIAGRQLLDYYSFLGSEYVILSRSFDHDIPPDKIKTQINSLREHLANLSDEDSPYDPSSLFKTIETIFGTTC